MKPIEATDELPEEFANAILNNNWQKAYEIIAPLANQDNASAQHTMGWFYQEGKEVKQSNTEAFKWWSISAPKGIPESQAGLGLLYLNGQGTDINYQKAFYWLSLALKNGQIYTANKIKQTKSKLSIWQYLYIKLLLLLKT